MAAYKFRVAAPFGRTSVVELPVSSEEEVELVQAFMLRIAPEMARTSLRSDTSVEQNAEHTLYWAMFLASKFAAFKNEALKAITPQDGTQKRQQNQEDAT
jgi:hypothetical protein